MTGTPAGTNPTRSITVDDRSEFRARLNEALAIDPGRTAALTIDMQREYLDESVGQSVVVPSEAKRVLTASDEFLGLCRDVGIPVVHAYVVRRPEEAEVGFHSGGLAYIAAGHKAGLSQAPHRPVRNQPDRVVGSDASQVPETLTAPGDIHVTEKKGLDSFAHTDLDFLLRRILDVDTLLLSGINTDTCVYSTTFTAANLGYRPVVISDCVASMRGIDSHEMALELISRSIAWVLDLEQLRARLRS
ncbi:MAG: isochorismatase family protein [Acidimicrobiia bacterium]|nr:isochorismatase family protein [Acidimicrobiia bacterium]